MNKLILIITVLYLQGCTSYARMTYEFARLGEKPAILYDVEEKDMAIQISKLLAANISIVEKKHFIAFKDINDLKVYIFSSKDRYSAFSGSTAKARASAIKNEVYISPIIKQRIETLGTILLHELTHVHLRQHIGTWRYWTEVPGWFHEGLAVEVSAGAGAEKVSDREAIAAIKLGKHFTPREESNIFGHKYASSYGLDHQMYYRQCGLFVSYLMSQNREAFKKSYLALIKGERFKDIWVLYYGKPVPALWQEYLEYVQA